MTTPLQPSQPPKSTVDGELRDWYLVDVGGKDNLKQMWCGNFIPMGKSTHPHGTFIRSPFLSEKAKDCGDYWLIKCQGGYSYICYKNKHSTVKTDVK